MSETLFITKEMLRACVEEIKRYPSLYDEPERLVDYLWSCLRRTDLVRSLRALRNYYRDL